LNEQEWKFNEQFAMTIAEKVQHWVNISDEDIRAGATMLQGGHYLYVGFMCQQTVEKIFKAAYTKLKEDTPPFTHDIISLAESSGFASQLSEEQLLFISEINPMHIEARYPEYKSEIAKDLTHAKCLNLLEQTKTLQQWIKETILSTK
jgi:HEPN domain-containing protein